MILKSVIDCWKLLYIITDGITWKTKKYHTVGTIQKSNLKIVETDILNHGKLTFWFYWPRSQNNSYSFILFTIV
jgi:DNA polymerase elongation subunit (family B)